MGHDRGCRCGNERWDYRTCPARVLLGGEGCSKESVIAAWDAHAAREGQKIMDKARSRLGLEMG
jgi:hypothetical protein